MNEFQDTGLTKQEFLDSVEEAERDFLSGNTKPIKSVFTEEDGSMTTHTYFNEDGLPEGGHSYGRGYCIAWQRGPLTESVPNGAYLEEVLQSCVDRLEQFQVTKFACEENEQAIFYIRSAIEELEARTARRTAEGTEGTWKGY